MTFEYKVIMSTCLIDGESIYPHFIWTNLRKETDCVDIGGEANMFHIK
jgi:hypothetical protein